MRASSSSRSGWCGRWAADMRRRRRLQARITEEQKMNTLCHCQSAMPSFDSAGFFRASSRTVTRVARYALAALAVCAVVYGGAFTLQHRAGSAEYAAATYVFADNQIDANTPSLTAGPAAASEGK